MDRLTYWCDDGMGGGEWRVNVRGNEFAGEEINHLAAYENTGLEPEKIEEIRSEMITCYDESGVAYHVSANGSEAKHIVDLLMAESQGRLVALPCYTGDKVYITLLGKILELEVGSIVLNGGVTTIYYYSSSFRSSPDDFGKTVFLTREEAEAALAGGDKGWSNVDG